MRIVITGAAGFLGRSVVERLVARGHEVRAVVRRMPMEPTWPKAIEPYACDLAVDDVSSALDGFEVVVHLAGNSSSADGPQQSVRATQRLCNAVQEAAIQHFVHVSSIAVYDWSRIDGLLDENCPLVSIADAPTPYAASKLRQEQITAPLGEGRLRLTTIRPGFLWGSSRLWVDGVGRQLAAGYLLVSPQALVPLSYVENCADAVATIVERKTSGAFNVVDQLDISRARYLAEYIRGTGKRGFVIPISYQLGLTTVSALSRVFGDMLSLRSLPSLVDRSRFEAQFKPVTVKAEKIRRELGWYPPFDFAESAKRSFA